MTKLQKLLQQYFAPFRRSGHSLTETGHGTGCIKQPKWKIKLHRAMRAKHKTIGAAPFDWVKGWDCEETTGVKFPIKNQNGAGECGGCAGSRFLEIVRTILGVPFEEVSEKSIYAPNAVQGGGMSMQALENQIANKGANSQADVPSWNNGFPPTEQFAEDKTWMTPELLQKAMLRAGWTAKTVAIDRESIAQAIRDYGAVIWIIEGSNNNTWNSQFPKHPVKGEQTWWHFMCSKGAIGNQINKYQSWGLMNGTTPIGLNGIQSFTDDYINSGYIHDVFTFFPTTQQAQKSTLIALIYRLMQLLGILQKQ
jgi:hypothetical protein